MSSLFDHTITISQVFAIEGNFDEETRKEILTKTREAAKRRLSAIQSEVIEAIVQAGGKVEGKARLFVKGEDYEAPRDAEFTVDEPPKGIHG